MTNPETSNKKPRRCQFISKIGSRCQADPQAGKAYCFFHDPEQKKKQAEACAGVPRARKQGGEERSRQTEPEMKLPPNLPIVRLQSAGEVFDLLAETVHHLQCSKMDVRVAQALAYLASLLLRALKVNRRVVAHLLSDTISQVRRGETDLRTAKTIGHLTAIMLTALKQEGEEAASLMEVPRSAEPTNAVEATRVPSLSGENIEAVTTLLAAAQPQDDPQLHPAMINGSAGHTQHHGGIQIP
jgi:hypothetical protein